MANQLLPFGFMDPRQADMMNWEQSRPAMGPIEAMSGMPDLYRQAAQQQYSHQPMADSFLRRFGQPMVEQQQQSPMQPDMLQALMSQGGMIDAMTNQGAQDAGTSFMQNARGGEGLAQYSGALADQPWLDEFANAGRQGVDLPMLQGNAGPQSDAMKAGIAERRQQRLGEQVPMKDRQAAVRQKALIKSEQRAGRMGDISQNEMYFNQAGRFADNMGGGQGDFLNAMMFGPEYGAGMAAVNQRGQESRDKLNFAGSVPGMVAGSIAGGNPISAQQVGQLMGGPPSAEVLLQQSGGDWNKYKTMANAVGMSGQETLDSWARMTGQQMGGPAKPGFFDMLGGLFQGAPSYQHENNQPYPIPYG